MPRSYEKLEADNAELEAKLAELEAKLADLEAENARLRRPYMFRTKWAWDVPLTGNLPAGVERTPAGVKAHFNDAAKQIRAELEKNEAVFYASASTDRATATVPEDGPVSMLLWVTVDFHIPLHGSQGGNDEVKQAAQAFGEDWVVPTIEQVRGVGGSVVGRHMKRR